MEMKVNFETELTRLEDNRIEINVTIPADDVDKAVADVYKEVGKTRIKGFRAGKAPRNVMDRVYGGPEYFLAEATEELVNHSYPLAIDSQDMVPLDTPDMGEIEPAVEGQPYQYKVSFTIAPDYELDSYEPLAIELPTDEPTEAEVQEKIDTMLGYYLEYIEIDDRPSQPGDVLTVDMEVTQDGERIEALSGEGVPYELGIEAMPEGFEENFIGILPGDHISIDFSLPYYDGNEDDEEQELHAEATLIKISEKKKPELTDEWVQEKLEYESAEHFRELLTDSLRLQKQSALPDLKERRIGDALAKRLIGDPPSLVVNDFAQDIYRDIFNTLQNQGITLDLFLSSSNQTAEEFREDVQARAENNARQAMALDAWARHAGITSNDDEVKEEFAGSGVDNPDELFEQWVEAGRISEIRQGIRRMKVSRLLNEEALVTEEILLPEPVEEVKPAKKTRKSRTKAAAEDDAVVDADSDVVPDEFAEVLTEAAVAEILAEMADADEVADIITDAAVAAKPDVTKPAKTETRKTTKATGTSKVTAKPASDKAKKPTAANQAAKKTGPKKV